MKTSSALVGSYLVFLLSISIYYSDVVVVMCPIFAVTGHQLRLKYVCRVAV